jgi:hypothetical protein
MSLSAEIRQLAQAIGSAQTPLRAAIESAVARGQVATRRCDVTVLLESWAKDVEALERHSEALHQLATVAGVVIMTPPPTGGGHAHGSGR